MHSPKQPVPWYSYTGQTVPTNGLFSFHSPTTVNTLYSSAEPAEDRDEFFIGSSYYAVRVEQAAEESGYPVDGGLVSEMDDTMLQMMDGGLEDEETINLQDTHRDNVVHVSDYQMHQLESEIDMLRRENRELRLIRDSVTPRQYGGDKDFPSGADVEEVVEEEHRTVQHNRPSVQHYDEAVQFGSSQLKDVGVGTWDVNRYHVIDLQSEKIDETQFPAEYWSRLVEELIVRSASARPCTRDVTFQSYQTDNRTTATMVTPAVSKDRRCFGVTVHPSTQDAAVGCLQPTTREFGCTTIETEAMIHEWVERNMGHLNDADRKLVTRLIKSSARSREEFIETVLSAFVKTTKAVGIEARLETKSSFTNTIDNDLNVSPIKPVSSEPPARAVVKTESQSVEARPLMMNKHSMTVRLLGTNVGVETETPLFRSQGAQASVDTPDLTGCGIQTDPSPRMVNSSVSPITVTQPRLSFTGIQTVSIASEKPSLSDASAPVSDPLRSYTIRSTGNSVPSVGAVPSVGGTGDVPRAARRRTSSYESGAADHKRVTDMREKIFSGSKVSRSVRLRSSRPMSPVEIQQYFPFCFNSSSGSHQKADPDRGSRSPDVFEFTQVGPSTEGYTVSVEQHGTKKLSGNQVHSDFTDVVGSSLEEHATVHPSESRTTPAPLISPNVRAFKPFVGVAGNLKDQELSGGQPIPFDRFVSRESGVNENIITSQLKQVSNDAFVASSQEHDIPISHGVQDLDSAQTGSNLRRIFDPNCSAGATAECFVTGHDDTTVRQQTRSFSQDSVEAVSAVSGTSSTVGPHSGQSDVDAVVDPTRIKTISTFPVSPSSEKRTTLTRTNRMVGFRIPARNNSFKMSDDVMRACEALAAAYRSGSTSRTNLSVAKELAKVSSTWFELSSASRTKLTQLEDFLAILNQYHDELLRDVIQSTDSQGSTSLHLAVGHGAWPVVDLILDSGYAEPDRLNAFGYSPIMISTVITTSGPDSLNTLDRLCHLGDVNLRSRSGSHQTPLMMAAQNRSSDVLELLLQHNASVNLQDATGNTALMFAIQNSDQHIVRVLINRPDIDLTLKDNRGDDALTIAMHQKDEVIVQWIRSALQRHAHESAESGDQKINSNLIS